MQNKFQSSFLELPALRIQQPLGEFFVVKFQAQDLLDISFSEPLAYVDEFGNVKGSQRPKKKERLQQIAKFVDSVEMAFPNSIILAANYTKLGTISQDESERWRVIEDTKCGIYRLIIPNRIKLAAIIDGQHRLNAFEYVTKAERFTDLQLVCSVYLDLPNSYQAHLFATINSNQKKVDRSLALEQFGFNVDDEPEKAWTPEKLAVFLSRKLNIDKDRSPFYKHVKVAPMNPEALFPDYRADDKWVISTATIVDGILSLISSNPKRDRIEMQQVSIFKGRNRALLSDIRDMSPLRNYFIELRDSDIYTIIINYFSSLEKIIWSRASDSSYITKTVGIQASFDLLKAVLKSEKEHNYLSIDFEKFLSKASKIDFSDKYFQASGIGRNRIKKVLGIATGIIEYKRIEKREKDIIDQIINNSTHLEVELWPWEEEAERVIANILEKAEWNLKAKSVRLYTDNNYEDAENYKDYQSFFQKLVELADQAYADLAPSDQEHRNEQDLIFNREDLVERNLEGYSAYLKDIGWW